MLTPPVFLLLLGLEAVAGALIAVSGHAPALVCFPSALGLTVCLYLLCDTKHNRREKPKKTTIALMFITAVTPVMAFFYSQWRMPHAGENDLSVFAGRTVYLDATVETVLPKKAGKYARFICSAKNVCPRPGKRRSLQKCDGSTMLFIPHECPVIGELTPGASVRCLCRVASIEGLDKRGNLGYATYLKRLAVTSLSYSCGGRVFVNPQLEPLTSPAAFPCAVSQAVESSRLRMIAGHTSSLGREIGSLLSAMVLGEKAVGLDAELLSSFRNVGLSHILAASGFNLTVVTFSTRWACSMLCIPALPSNCLSFLMMIVFVLFAGNSSSVVRAGLMCALAIVCHSFSRRVEIAGLLGAALVISILIDPVSAADPGYQLSYVAVSGIIFVVAPLAQSLETFVERRWLRWSLNCIATVIVAQACVLPLQMFYFKQVGLLFLPANLLASLVVTPVTVAGFASSLIFLLCPQGIDTSGSSLSSLTSLPALLLRFPAAGLDWLAAIPLKLLVFAVSFLSDFPFAVLTVPPMTVWQVMLYYFVLFYIFYFLLGKLPGKRACKN